MVSSICVGVFCSYYQSNKGNDITHAGNGTDSSIAFFSPFLYLSASGEAEAGPAEEQPARNSRTRENGRRKLRPHG